MRIPSLQSILQNASKDTDGLESNIKLIQAKHTMKLYFMYDLKKMMLDCNKRLLEN